MVCIGRGGLTGINSSKGPGTGVSFSQKNESVARKSDPMVIKFHDILDRIDSFEIYHTIRLALHIQSTGSRFKFTI